MIKNLTKLSPGLMLILVFSRFCYASEATYGYRLEEVVKKIEALDMQMIEEQSMFENSAIDKAQYEQFLKITEKEKDVAEKELSALLASRQRITRPTPPQSQEQTTTTIGSDIQKIVQEHARPGINEADQKLVTRVYRANNTIPVPGSGIHHVTASDRLIDPVYGSNISLPAFRRNVTVYIVPTLQQARSETQHTNYCGYYAIFNALRLAKTNNPAGAVAPTQENREIFLTYFSQWLAIDKEYRQEPLKKFKETAENSNLSLINDDEIMEIITKSKLPVTFSPLQTIMEDSSFKDLAEIMPNQYGTLYAFSNSITPGTICFIGSTSSSDGHWFAFRVDRDTVGNLTFYIADSLQRTEWYDDEYLLITRILPYAYLLLGQLDAGVKAQFESIHPVSTFTKKPTI
jgi:hypothetical protein